MKETVNALVKELEELVKGLNSSNKNAQNCACKKWLDFVKNKNYLVK